MSSDRGQSHSKLAVLITRLAGACRRWVNFSSTKRVWLLAGLLSTRLFDATVTYYGLQVGMTELNPVAVSVMNRFGAAFGLLLLSIFVLLLIGIMGEFVVPKFFQSEPTRQRMLTFVYGVPTMLWLGVCIYNLVLIGVFVN